MDGKDNYKVPTIEEIKEALKVPEIDIKFDNLGRVIRKKNTAKSVLTNSKTKTSLNKWPYFGKSACSTYWRGHVKKDDR